MKIAVLHPCMAPGGGSEARALWLIQALKNDFNMTLITTGRIDFDQFNLTYGTSLSPDEVRAIQIRMPVGIKSGFDALRGYLFARYCRKHSSDFDLMISAYNPMDFGRKGIQFIADFSFHECLRETFHPSARDYVHRLGRFRVLRSAYSKIFARLNASESQKWLKNVTIANSEWSRSVFKKTFGLDCPVIYPPVVGRVRDNPWNNREEGFVMIGRLVPEKGLDMAVEILKRVRMKGRDIHLHIVGRKDNISYVRKIESLCQAHRNWVFFEGMKLGDAKFEMLTHHKYGISCRWHEPFGIAVAEMAKSGCVVWIPRGGGQVEIVGRDDLIFDDMDDAVGKIDRVLSDKTRQIEMSHWLEERAEMFSTEKFAQQVRALVSDFFQKSGDRIQEKGFPL